ncbi:DUF393 domain-containing protein [Pseudovibrio sp. SPO723]|uniref:thiol-disulfide oxidoreductase DCC family protein n=1 Tax=Nesiotobacter zosterae TaxID=392721 RepID=UPI0029C3047E|nr:DUF393 domain-containing protein [Pseudovibrio sp. SPO723]MDX5593283.1 DUF393 domain-containing protein [Pseudovibrio sp. SPO723]
MITVFYDGKCGLCAREINHYRKIAPEGRITFADVATYPQRLDGTGLNQADALRYLHAVDAAGQVHKGASAFTLIWSEIDGWRWLVPVVRAPIIKQLVDVAYAAFAHLRFKMYRHCRVAELTER